MGSGAPGTGPLSPDFSGISPELMGRFVTEIEHARGVIGEHTEAVRRVFAAHGLPAASLGPIGEVERWIDDRLPELRRRRQMADGMARLPAWTPGAASLVPYEEKDVLSPAEARRLGRELADYYRHIDPDAPFDVHLDEKYRKVVDALAAHQNDPEFTAAFFAGIGARRTIELPRRVRAILQERVPEALETVSRAFGTAVAGAGAAPGLAAVIGAVGAKAGSVDDQEAIGELLSAGRFPTEWLAQVVALQIFLPEERATGSSLTGYLRALARDPAAARLAIGLATRDSPLPRDVLGELLAPARPGGLATKDVRPDLATFLRRLNDRAATDPASADAFGRLLASAAGAYDEKDGRHSDVAARFAFDVITRTAGFPFAAPTRVHLAEIAGAYATEMTEGANLGDDNQLQPSAFGAVDSRISGLNPAFRLSPADTLRFMTTFAGSEESRRPFDAGMGDLARRLIDEGVPAMMKDKDPTRLDDVFAALGNVRGFELAAAEKLGRPIDEDAADADKYQGFTVGLATALAGFAVPEGIMAELLWEGLSTGFSVYDTYKDDPETEVGRLDATDDRETLGRQHTIAQALMDAGFTPAVSPGAYQAACPPGVAIADGDGRLRPFADILESGEQGLQALDQWFIANGMGRDKKSLAETARFLSDRFDGRKQGSRTRAALFAD